MQTYTQDQAIAQLALINFQIAQKERFIAEKQAELRLHQASMEEKEARAKALEARAQELQNELMSYFEKLPMNDNANAMPKPDDSPVIWHGKHYDKNRPIADSIRLIKRDCKTLGNKLGLTVTFRWSVAEKRVQALILWHGVAYRPYPDHGMTSDAYAVMEAFDKVMHAYTSNEGTTYETVNMHISTDVSFVCKEE